MTLKRELPRTGDINKCCGAETIISKMRVDVRMMADPPKTADRWVHITHWQCNNISTHNGEVWLTADEPNMKHVNVFEQGIDESEIGNENQQRN